MRGVLGSEIVAAHAEAAKVHKRYEEEIFLNPTGEGSRSIIGQLTLYASSRGWILPTASATRMASGEILPHLEI